MKRKSLIISIIAIIAIIAIAISYYLYNSKTTELVKSPYISAHTSGTISSKTDISVYFTKNMIDKNVIGTQLPENVVEISPNIKGKAMWIETNLLKFTPEKPFKNGEKYTVTINISQIANAYKDADSYSFEVNILKQNFNLYIDNIQLKDNQDYNKFTISGSVNFADVIGIDKIKNIVSASLQDDDYKVNWEEINSKQFSFKIDNITRPENPQDIKIKYNGKSIGVDKKGVLVATIPAKNQFKLMYVKTYQAPEQKVVLIFSDPIDRNQDINGLVRFDKISQFNTTINNNVITLNPIQHKIIVSKLYVNRGIKSTNNKTFSTDTVFEVSFKKYKPAVRQKTDKVILVPNGKSLFPFDAVNLKAVDLRIYKVPNTNILQFLQINKLNGSYELRRVASPILEKTVVLNEQPGTDIGNWNTYYFDLSKIIKDDPSALYHIEISYRKENAITESDVDKSKAPIIAGTSFWQKFTNYCYANDYNWKDRDNPDKDTYYGYRRALRQNFMVSDIGLIAKKGQNNELNIFAIKLSDNEPLADANIEVLNYQQLVQQKGKTNSDGYIHFSDTEKAYFVKASSKKYSAYIRLEKNESLSYSQFPTSGEIINNGLKGFIYTERGVYRPGDTIHVGFMLYDTENKLPSDIPLTIKLKNARNQLVDKKILSRNNLDNYLNFFTTNTTDPTGRWQIEVLVADHVFSKSISVETIKPNRLKIKVECPKIVSIDNNKLNSIHVEYLHGAKAPKFKATVEASSSVMKLHFTDYPEYTFNCTSSKLDNETKLLETTSTDENGDFAFKPFIPKGNNLPSLINLSYFIKIFEPNGNFSINSFSQKLKPYSSYVGFKLPKPSSEYGLYETKKPIKLNIVALTPNGEKLRIKQRVKVRIYKVRWSWWWDIDDNYNYQNSRYKILKQSKTISVNRGEGTMTFKVADKDWGRYLIEIENIVTGQKASKYIYFDWPSEYGKQNLPDGMSQTMLRFSTDKKSYELDETVNITFPSSEFGKALISIENGTKMLKYYWVDTQNKETKFSFTTTKDMSPNCYINIQYIQNYKLTKNNEPLRLYGIAGIDVTNAKNKLLPQIEVKNTIESDKPFTVTVSEKNNNEMSYTIAVVDEGLLSLTNFKTPNPYNKFFKHEALGVRTWDMFDWIIGAYNGRLERVIGIGGGSDGNAPNKNKNKNRFKPIVWVKGPFKLGKNQKQKQIIKLSHYIGEVRVMVIARNTSAFGNAEKSIKVKSPLMIMSTAPRQLVPGDKFQLPVTVFRDINHQGVVKVTLKSDKNILISSKSKTIDFDKGQQDKTVYFTCEAGKTATQTNIQAEATEGNNNTHENVALKIENPNEPLIHIQMFKVKKGKKQKVNIEPIGNKESNKLTCEVSTIPPFNLKHHINYLLNYPHGCIEQTISGVFGLIYADKIMDINNKKVDSIKNKIVFALNKIAKFQTTSGGMSYWPGNKNVNEWGSSYAMHFLVELKNAGYAINKTLWDKLLTYQQHKARNWINEGPSSQTQQAYRLYTLALAHKSIKSAMNRLRNIKTITQNTAWLLSAAYSIAGKTKAATKLIDNMQLYSKTQSYYYTFGSSLRDKAIKLQALDLAHKNNDAHSLILDISENMISNSWYSTQTRAWALYSLEKYYAKQKIAKDINISYSIDNKTNKKIKTTKPVLSYNIPIKNKPVNINVVNNSNGYIYLQYINQGIPLQQHINAQSSNLYLEVNYYNLKGSKITINNLKQTTDFVAKITVTHPGIKNQYNNLALSFTAPSGWEIINTRFTDFNNSMQESSFDYRDIKDNKVYTYFNLGVGQTKTFYIKLNATYAGEFFMAPVSCLAMYDNKIRANSESGFVKVEK